MDLVEIMNRQNILLTEIACRTSADITESDIKQLDRYEKIIAEINEETTEQTRADLIDGMGYEIPLDSNWKEIIEYIRNGLSSGELITY